MNHPARSTAATDEEELRDALRRIATFERRLDVLEAAKLSAPDRAHLEAILRLPEANDLRSSRRCEFGSAAAALAW